MSAMNGPDTPTGRLVELFEELAQDYGICVESLMISWVDLSTAEKRTLKVHEFRTTSKHVV